MEAEQRSQRSEVDYRLAQGLSSSKAHPCWRADTALETTEAQPGPGLEISLYISLKVSHMAEIKTFIQREETVK